MDFPKQNKRLLDQVTDKLRLKHYSIRTEHSYISWIKRYIYFHGKQHPATLGKEAIEAFLTDLAVRQNVAPSTQNQAFNALLFLYREVLEISLEDAGIKAIRAKEKIRVPVVLTQDEVQQIIQQMDGIHQLVANLLYGGGLRLLEGLRLRVKDKDMEKSIFLMT